MKHKLPPALLLIFVFTFFSCRKEDTPDPAPQPREEVVAYGVAYGTDSLQIMDVYIPYGLRDTMALLVMVHGGSWYTGDRSHFAAWFEYEKNRKQYAAINIEYRLDTDRTVPVPMQTDDIAAAIRAVKEKYDLNTGKIGMLGVSAGAHLAALYAYHYDTEHHVKAVVDWCGPVDFNDPQYHEPGHWAWIFSGIEYIFGRPYQGNEDYYASVSPYFYVNAQSPPTIILHGEQDTLVPPSQAIRLHEKLDRAGVDNELRLYPHSGHIFERQDGLDAFWHCEPFLDRHLLGH